MVKSRERLDTSKERLRPDPSKKRRLSLEPKRQVWSDLVLAKIGPKPDDEYHKFVAFTGMWQNACRHCGFRLEVGHHFDLGQKPREVY
jgi:hypothetical protein